MVPIRDAFPKQEGKPLYRGGTCNKECVCIKADIAHTTRNEGLANPESPFCPLVVVGVGLVRKESWNIVGFGYFVLAY